MSTALAITAAAERPARAWIRPKRHLSPAAWWTLAALAFSALAVLAAKRAGWEWLAATCSLEHLPASLKAHLGHLFIVPVAALVVTFARLTLNLRTLGPFRAMLLAMAFESVGYGLGLAFFAIVTAVVMALRPGLRSLGLPYYARVLAMVSIVSGIVVLVLVVASATGVVDLARVASFPIVVLAMTGDTSSRILAKEGVLPMLGRFATTLAAAAIVAAIVAQPAVRAILIAYPEVLALQVVALVLVSELFDVRLLGDAGAARKSKRRQAAGAVAASVQRRTAEELAAAPFRVAVVRNRSRRGILGAAGGRRPARAYSRKAIQRILRGLRAAGFEAKVFEGDATLLPALAAFLPVDGSTGRVHGMVLNLAAGIQGNQPAAHVPAMLEMAGVPYTGAGPEATMVAADLAAQRARLVEAGIATPAHVLLRTTDGSTGHLEYPLRVRPRSTASTRQPRVVANRAELEAAVSAVLARSGCDAVVESHVEGRLFTVALVGGDAGAESRGTARATGGRSAERRPARRPQRQSERPPEGRSGGALMRALPVTEIAVAVEPGDDGAPTTVTRRTCPAEVDATTAMRLQATAAAACAACGLRDLARVDLRLDAEGEIMVMQVHAAPALGWAGITVRAARRAGFDAPRLLAEIVRGACARAGIRIPSTPVPQGR